MPTPLSYRLLIALALLFWAGIAAKAQTNDEIGDLRETWITWDDFIEEFLLLYPENEEDTAPPLRLAQQEALQHLEELKEQPFDLNQANRDQLLSLPWLKTEQVDSLLAYRQRTGRFTSLGDLMALPLWSYQDRRWLSLFVYVGQPPRPAKSWRERLLKGQHRIAWSANMPLYLREGFSPYNHQGKPHRREQTYLGSPLSHTLRYRHRSQQLQWGATFQNDSGEPFAQRGNYPYDHQSAYLHWQSQTGNREVLLGDYNLQWGQGLVFGHHFLLSPLHYLLQARPVPSRFRPHTSSEETQFLRGVALKRRWKHWQLMAFASHRWRDGRMEQDTLRSFINSGWHRNLTELSRRRVVGVSTCGAQLQREQGHWRWGTQLYAEHYNRLIAPNPRPYNRYYLRRQWAATWSTDYAWQKDGWTAQGEVATDLHLNWSTTHLLCRAWHNGTSLLGQFRWFSPRFVSPHASPLAQSSRGQNEWGVALGLSHQWNSGLKMHGFIDIFRFEQPTFRATQPSQGLELQAECEWRGQSQVQHLLRYRWHTRQHDLPKQASHLEYRHTHRLHYQWRKNGKTWNWQVGLQGSLHHRQTWHSPTWGAMISSRSSFLIHQQWNIAAFLALFHTADHDTRFYAYQPQLQHAGLFPSFAHHGASAVLQAQWRVSKAWRLALRSQLLHYFDRENIGSGTQRIANPTQTDLSALLECRF